MANDPLVAPPVLSYDKVVMPTLAPGEVPAPPATLPPPTAEQVQACDQAFSEVREQELVAGLLGMQVGILLLRDIAVQTFETPPDEDERRRKLPRLGEDEAPR
jgi:hypothetical protein